MCGRGRGFVCGCVCVCVGVGVGVRDVKPELDQSVSVRDCERVAVCWTGV